MKINNLDNPIFIFLLFLTTIIVNTISSIYFFPIMLLGILFMGFFVCLKNRYYYSLLFIIMGFLFIELNNGFKAFSITLLASFVYIFIAPYIKRVLSFNTLNPYIYISIFYIGVYVLWLINNDYSNELAVTLFTNLIIDFILFGVLI
ncbi:hypothetical protein [Arcobacter sp. LA11]|uniref:hypothetical protein n=1 Tax=Arcobacter sp. LA11 TaxID=1898176 RepID=UPI000932BC44|nr:hypothetical protein [Arcobacter sp. LA11]